MIHNFLPRCLALLTESHCINLLCTTLNNEVWWLSASFSSVCNISSLPNGISIQLSFAVGYGWSCSSNCSEKKGFAARSKDFTDTTLDAFHRGVDDCGQEVHSLLVREGSTTLHLVDTFIFNTLIITTFSFGQLSMGSFQPSRLISVHTVYIRQTAGVYKKSVDSCVFYLFPIDWGENNHHFFGHKILRRSRHSKFEGCVTLERARPFAKWLQSGGISSHNVSDLSESVSAKIFFSKILQTFSLSLLDFWRFFSLLCRILGAQLQ